MKAPSTLWEKLLGANLLVPAALGGIPADYVYLTTDQAPGLGSLGHRPWVIGRHHALKQLAKGLRIDPVLRDRFAHLRVRLGDRANDNPPIEPAVRRIEASPLKQNLVAGRPFQRQRDFFQGVEDFWRCKTLESHHIVEDNIVEKLEQDTGELDREQAPCVLLAAELHQRVFSAAMTRLGQRDAFSPKSSPAEVLKQLESLIEELYVRAVVDRAPFRELKALAAIINQDIFDRLAAKTAPPKK